MLSKCPQMKKYYEVLPKKPTDKMVYKSRMNEIELNFIKFDWNFSRNTSEIAKS